MDAVTLRSAFRRLSKALHPDTTSLPADEATRRFQEVCEAYEILSNPLLRKAYDNTFDAVSLTEKPTLYEDLVKTKGVVTNSRSVEVRRSFSGGELFSLLSLGVALLLSLLLAIVFAFTQGREWQSQPSWLMTDPTPGIVIAQYPRNVSTPIISNLIESTFPRSFGSLAV